MNVRKIAAKVRQTIYKAPENNSVVRLSATLAVEGLLAAIVLNLATSYSQMFASRLGATDTQVGLVSSLPQLLALLVLIPGALLASRVRDRRRPVEFSIIMIGVLYGIAGFSPWIGNHQIQVWFLIGAVSLANAPMALYNATWQSYFSDIVSIEDRNAVYAVRTSMTFIAGMFTLQITGIILGSIQSESVRILLYQICYWLSLIVSIIQFRVLRRAPSDVGDHVATGWRDLLTAAKGIVKSRGFVVFCLMSFFFHASWYMAWPLFFLIQVNYLGANEFWLGLIAVPASIIQWLTVKPWSRFIEKHGIRFTLLIGCIGLTANPLLAVLAAYLPPEMQLPGMVFMNLLNGFTFCAFQLSILQCMLEVVPARFRTINISVYTSLLLLANAITPILGVEIYVALGSNLQAMTLAMAISSIARVVGTGFFALRWFLLRKRPDCGMRI